ncbi:oxidoreductase [Serinibacter arcticus]|uniref:Oxidoreductase n=1 Tax=Serinibacter arcticus TaxID=1655435 RepID=A0A2U1ZSG5_9MICO|nr:NADH:flavin oxidoreductase/NADH oxidase [Serinibacter arcticus]PWD49927.1 oxidoreductase [Serinibacter arcticus]
MTSLFDPIQLRDLTVPNRVWLSPMCMFACEQRDGVVGDFHLAHYGGIALGGTGLLVTEATAVSPDGRVSPDDAGLWDDAQVAPWRRVTDLVHAAGATIAVQLAHAGRKGSKHRALLGDDDLHGSVPPDRGGWETLGATGTAFGRYTPPRRAAATDLEEVVHAFVDAAERAVAAGFDAVELHGAHGYLLHETLSPLTSSEDPAWGGDPSPGVDGRERLLLETVRGVRRVIPAGMPLIVRLSVSDVAPGGSTAESTLALVERLAGEGVDLVDCSSGGLLAGIEYDAGPGYQVPGAAVVRRAGLPVGAVGLLDDPHLAQSVLTDGSADVVLLGRALLRDPHWVRHAAHALGRLDDVPEPARYSRGWREIRRAATTPAA